MLRPYHGKAPTEDFFPIPANKRVSSIQDQEAIIIESQSDEHVLLVVDTASKARDHETEGNFFKAKKKSSVEKDFEENELKVKPNSTCEVLNEVFQKTGESTTKYFVSYSNPRNCFNKGPSWHEDQQRHVDTIQRP